MSDSVKNNAALFIRQSLSLALCALLMIVNATFVYASNPKTIDDVLIDELKIHPEHEYSSEVLKVSLVAEKVADNQLVWKTLLYSTDHKDSTNYKDSQTDDTKFWDYRTDVRLMSLTVEHGMLIARDEVGQYYAVEPKSGALWAIKNNRSKINFDIEMAKLFYQKKEYADAFEIWQNNRRTLEKQFGSDDLSLAYCDASMALVRYAEGLNAEGLLLYQNAMSLARKILLAGPKNHLLNQIRYSDFTSPKVIKLINEGDSVTEAKNFPKIIDNLKQALDLDPYNFTARDSLAIEYNNYGVSISDSSRALQLFENSLFYCRRRGSLGELNSCMNELGKNYRSAKDHLALANKALQENSPQRAVVEYSEAMKIDPSCLSARHAYYVPSLLNLASFYAKVGNISKANALIKQALDNLPKQAANEKDITVFALRNCSPLLPKDVLEKLDLDQFSTCQTTIKNCCLLAAALANNGKALEAEAVYKKMLKQYEELSEQDHNVFVAPCLFIATLYYDDHDKYQETVPLLAKTLENYWVGADPDFSTYMSDEESRIARVWNSLNIQPEERRNDGRTIVDYNIQKNGQISHIKIEHSSGNNSLDQAALVAIKKVNPFPIPPLGQANPINIRFTFDDHILGGRSAGAAALTRKYFQELGDRRVIYMAIPPDYFNIVVLAAQDPFIVGKKYKRILYAGSRGAGYQFTPLSKDGKAEEDKEIFVDDDSWSEIEIKNKREKAMLLRLANRYLLTYPLSAQKTNVKH